MREDTEELLKDPEWIRPEGVDSEDPQAFFQEIWLKIEQQRLLAGQPRTDSSSGVLHLGQSALTAAEHFGDIRWTGEACAIMAYVLNANESYSDSLPYYARAVENLERAGQHANAAQQKLGYIYALLMTGQYQDALRIGEEAEACFIRHNDEIGHAKLQMNLGNVHHRLDNHTAAHECYSQAAVLFRKNGNLAALANVYLNLGNVLSTMGTLEESDAAYAEADSLCRQLGLSDLLLQTTYNRAYLAFLRGRYADAIQSFGELRTLFNDTNSARHSALCDLDEAEIYLQLNAAQNAAILAKRAADKFDKLNMRYEQAKATAFFGLALCQSRQFGEALDAFRLARSQFTEEGNLYWQAILDLYIAEIMFSLGRTWEARPLTLKAMERFRQLEIPPLRAICLVLLGRISIEIGQIEKAQEYANEIIALTQKENVPLLLFPSYSLCAQVAERTGNLQQAQEFYELAAQELDTHRTHIHHDELRATFFQSKQQIYEGLVRLYLKDQIDSLPVISAAFNCIERSKSRNLLDLFGNDLPTAGWNKDQDLLHRVKRLREELNSHYLRTRPEASVLPAAPVEDVSDQKEMELARNLKELARMDPEFASLHGATVSLKDLQNALDPDTTVVEYFVARDEVMALVISASKVTVVRHICPLGRVRYLLERFDAQIQKFERTPETARQYEADLTAALDLELRDLYVQLFSRVRGLIGTSRLIIIPHGVLHLLPFHLFRDERYLFEDFAISYSPSASVATYSLAKRDVSGRATTIINTIKGSPRLALPGVPGLTDEFRVFEHDQATRENFDQAAAKSAFLMISSRMVFRQDNPVLSALRLTDGMVSAIELYSTVCNANVVALDLQYTGARHNDSPEVMLAVPRAFLYAGARSVLMPLWQVADPSTAQLLANFYDNSLNGDSRPEALARAMNSVRIVHPHPYFWGSFLLLGR